MEMNDEDENPPTEAELMLTIACYAGSEASSTEEQKEADAAFTCLYERHESALRQIVGARLRKYHTFNFDPDDIFMQVCEKIWGNAEKFDPKGDDPEGIKKQFLGWSKTICWNLVSDSVRGIHFDLGYGLLEKIEHLLPSSKSSPLSEDAKVLAVALKKLPDSDQDVLRAMADSLRFDGKARRANSGDLEALAACLGVAVPSLRVKRQRAIKNLKTELEKIASAAIS